MLKDANRTFFAGWSNDMSYVLGFWFADGTMSRPTTHASISFTSKDRDHLVAIAEIMAAKQSIYKRPDGCYKLTIGSRTLWDDLGRLGGIPAKSLVVAMPSIPHVYLRHFARGFVDGDGCLYWDIGNRRRPVISVFGGVPFLAGLATAIDDATGVGVARVVERRGRVSQMTYPGIKAKVLARWLNDDAPLALARKRALARSFAA